MGLFSSAKAKLAAQNLAEERLFQLAAEEIAANNIRPGLWAKAISEADGDDAKAKARYIKLRVDMMKAETDLESYVVETAFRAAANEKAAAYEAAASAKAEADPTNRAIKFLETQNYNVTFRRTYNRYRINEPLVGRTGWKTKEELMDYAVERGFKV